MHKEYYGLFHIHSDISYDGKLPLEKLKEIFKDKNYSFLLMTEHYESLDYETYQDYIERCRSLSDNNFKIIPGIEFHSECIAVVGLKSSSTLNASIKEQLSVYKQQNLPVILVHPSSTKDILSSEFAGLSDAVEIWNVKNNGIRYPLLNDIKIWAKIHKGSGASPIAGLDLHDERHCKDISIKIKLENLDDHEIIQAIKVGNYSIYVNGKPLDVENLSCSVRIKIYVYDKIIKSARAITRLFGGIIPWGLKDRLKRTIKGDS